MELLEGRTLRQELERCAPLSDEDPDFVKVLDFGIAKVILEAEEEDEGGMRTAPTSSCASRRAGPAATRAPTASAESYRSPVMAWTVDGEQSGTSGVSSTPTAS